MKSEEHHKNMNLLMDKVVVKQKDFQKDPQRQLLNQSSDRQMYSVKKKIIKNKKLREKKKQKLKYNNILVIKRIIGIRMIK